MEHHHHGPTKMNQIGLKLLQGIHHYLTSSSCTYQLCQFIALNEFIMFEYSYQPNPNLFDPQCANPMSNYAYVYRNY
jgi:hypothetical protein